MDSFENNEKEFRDRLLQVIAYVFVGIAIAGVVAWVGALGLSMLNRIAESKLENIQGMYVSEEPGLTYYNGNGTLATRSGNINVIYGKTRGRRFEVYNFTANMKPEFAWLNGETKLLVVEVKVEKDRIILKIVEDHVFDNQYEEIVLYKVEGES